MQTAVSRRTVLKGIAATGVASTGPFVILRQGWAQTGPIKIGILEPLSGPVAYIGEGNIAGFRFGAEHVNAAGGVLGRKLELVSADSELKPDVATRRANDLVLADKVDVLAVNTGSNIAKAVSQVASQAKKVFYSTGTEAAEMTGEEFFDTTFRCCLNTDMHSAELAIYFAKMAPEHYTKFYLLNQDYNFGRAAADGFKKKFNKIKAPDQQIVGDEYHPLQKTQDFGPYITKIMASGAQVVMTGDWGQDLRLFLQQGAALGWKVKVGNYFLDDPNVMKTVGKAAIGHITADAYLSTVDTKTNLAFVKAWRARYPDAPISYKYPTLTVGRCANATMWLADAIKRAGSLDTQKMIKAWEGSRFTTPWGVEVEMRACDHQMQTQGYVAEIMPPEKIPSEIRFFGTEFPYLGKPVLLPKDEVTIPPRETGNKRCA
jgi:branched-chain amino acid transport system substrate-binding protein